MGIIGPAASEAARRITHEMFEQCPDALGAVIFCDFYIYAEIRNPPKLRGHPRVRWRREREARREHDHGVTRSIVDAAERHDIAGAKAIAMAEAGQQPQSIWWFDHPSDFEAAVQKLYEFLRTLGRPDGYDIRSHQSIAWLDLWVDR